MDDTPKKMSLPSSPLPSIGPANIIHSGYLNKLSGKSLLYPGSWKRRYCVLDTLRLYYYESKEDKDTSSSPDKTHNYINLEYYDSCEEANSKDVRKATNVFVISSSDKTFFESGRLYFSAETLTEMNDWITKIRSVMETLQKIPKKRNSSKNVKPIEDKWKTSSSKQSKTSAEEKSNGETKLSPTTSNELGQTELSLSSETQHLECITKQRAKGPAGRRLPRQRFTTINDLDGNHRQKRSGSLSLLEVENTSTRSASDLFLSDDSEQKESPICSSLSDCRRFDQTWFLNENTNMRSEISSSLQEQKSADLSKEDGQESLETNFWSISKDWICILL